MNPLSANLQTIATNCSLCHDQCVSACPVVEMTSRLIGYPSRLATLAWELERGNLSADAETMLAMLHCIHCNACTRSCVYIDDPVDITPFVRYTRQKLIQKDQATPQMRQMLERIQLWGNPYLDIQNTLNEMKVKFGQNRGAIKTLVIADAAELAYAPAAAHSGLRLLQRLGYNPLALSSQSYTGWELWQYGYGKELLGLAEALVKEIEHRNPEVVITLSPVSAYLLRKVFPEDLGISISAKVLSLPEAVLARLEQPTSPALSQLASIYLVMSCAETYQLQSFASREVLELFGITCLGIPNNQPYHRSSFPEGLALELYPTPGNWFARKIAETVVNLHPDAIVCTAGMAWKAMHAYCPDLPVTHWSTFVLSQLTRNGEEG